MNDTKKHKYTAIGFTYLLGLICASFMGKTLCFAVFIILVAAFVIIVYLKRKASLLHGVLAASFIISGLYQATIIDKSYELEGKTAYVTGRITEKLTPDNDTVMLSIDGTADGIPVKFTLFVPDAGFESGDKVKFSASFSRFIDKQYFAESSYHYSKGIFLKASAESEILIEKGIISPAVIMERVSDNFKSRLDTMLSEDSAGIIKAMLFGDKSGLSPRLSVNIKRSGVAHLTAVSGMHLSLMAHTVVSLITVLTGRKRILASLISSFYIIIMMLFFGMTVSVMRSGIMLLFYYGGAFFGRKTRTLNSVDKALFLILAINPCACRDIGLWLSVLGTIGVSEVSEHIHKKLKINRKSIIKSMLVSSLSASLCTAPIGMFCFGGISVTAAITGILLQPFFTVILVFIPTGLIIPFIFIPLIYFSGLAAKIMNFIINIIGGFDFSYFETDAVITIYLIAVIFICSMAIYIFTGRASSAVYTVCSVLSAFVAATVISSGAEYDNIKISVFSDGSEAVMRVENKNEVSVFTLSDSKKTEKMIYEYTAGKNLKFVCIAADTDNNEINKDDYKCSVHLPENGDMLYNMGDYSVYIIDNEVLINICGITVGMTDIKSRTKSDISVRLGYGKDFHIYGNYATVLCDKKFYNCKGTVNACYEEVEFIIDKQELTAVAVH